MPDELTNRRPLTEFEGWLHSPVCFNLHWYAMWGFLLTVACIIWLVITPTSWWGPQLRLVSFRSFVYFMGLICAGMAITREVLQWLIVRTRINGQMHIVVGEERTPERFTGGCMAIMCAYAVYEVFYQTIAPNAWLPLTTICVTLFGIYAQTVYFSFFGIPKFQVDLDTWNHINLTEKGRQRVAQQAARERQFVAQMAAQPQEGSILAAQRPRFTFADVHGMEPLKTRLIEAAKPVFEGAPPPAAPQPAPHGRRMIGTSIDGYDPHAPQDASAGRRDGKTPRNGIMLSGDPGNGKTFLAEALAGQMGVRFLTMDYGKVVSKWVGDTPQRIAQAFADARAAAPCVLFIDEIDSFIVDRDSRGHNSNESASIVNLLLTELVNIRQHHVLVLAATNRLEKLDGAAIREGRFDYKIEVPPPDITARVGLLTSSLDRSLAGAAIERVDLEAVRSAAERWEGFSVKRIQAVGEEMPSYLSENPSPVVGYEQLMGALRRIQGRKGKLPANAKGLADLVLPDETSQALQLIARRIADPLRVERLGGSLPAGVLFHGPAGTGKTAVARALAKDTGWAFLSVAGPDLLKDVDELEKVYRQACDLRPAIIFIDEADDVLRNRQYSASGAITNKMLTVLDGAGGKVKDVLFIAATNNPDQIDPAMLRAGRFTEKVPFFAASAATAPVIVERWLASKKATLAAGVTPARVGKLLDGQSPANIEGVMQYALNLAIDATLDHDPTRVSITLDQVARALDVVAPEA